MFESPLSRCLSLSLYHFFGLISLCLLYHAYSLIRSFCHFGIASALCQLYKISFINNNTICQYPIYIRGDILCLIFVHIMLCLCHCVRFVSGRIICILNGNTFSSKHIARAQLKTKTRNEKRNFPLVSIPMYCFHLKCPHLSSVRTHTKYHWMMNKWGTSLVKLSARSILFT